MRKCVAYLENKKARILFESVQKAILIQNIVEKGVKEKKFQKKNEEMLGFMVYSIRNSQATLYNSHCLDL